MAPQQPQGRRPPTLQLDRFRLVISFDWTNQVRLHLGEGVNTVEAKALLDYIYARVNAYLEEVTKPPPPREQPSPHYRSIQSELPTRIDESG